MTVQEMMDLIIRVRGLEDDMTVWFCQKCEEIHNLLYLNVILPMALNAPMTRAQALVFYYNDKRKRPGEAEKLYHMRSQVVKKKITVKMHKDDFPELCNFFIKSG